MKGANDDQTKGIDIVRRAITAPVKQIATNAGHDGAVVSGSCCAKMTKPRASTLRPTLTKTWLRPA